MPHHARRAHTRLTPLASTIASVCAFTGAAFVLHSGAPALAAIDQPVVPVSSTSTPLAETTSIVASSGADEVEPFARTVRAIQREQLQIRRAARQEERERRELRQERREQVRERAARAAERELGRWVWPISGASMSAYFGESGSSWSSGYHTGQDFTAPYGTPVYAASGGTITFAGWSDAYGNKIEITHPDGNQTWYAHMSSLERSGGTVEPGQVIGYVGCTGNCYGNHLHFEFHPGGGEASDPVAWLRRHGAG